MVLCPRSPVISACDACTARANRSLKPGKIVQRNRRKWPHLRQAAAEHAARVEQPIEQIARTRKDGAGCRVEILVERDVDRIKWPRGVRYALTGIRRLQKEAGAIEVQSDTLAPGERYDRLKLRGIELLAQPPAHGRLDPDDRDTRCHTSSSRLIKHALHIFGGERGASSGKGNERQIAQRLATSSPSS